MPLYEYTCPQHGRFEALRGMDRRYSVPCPQCGDTSVLIPSIFRVKQFTRLDQADGEGFTSRFMSNAELAEVRKGNAMGQT